nr:hypothetical protein [Rubripirellula sp.]
MVGGRAMPLTAPSVTDRHFYPADLTGEPKGEAMMRAGRLMDSPSTILQSL